MAIRHTQHLPHPLFLNLSEPFNLFCPVLLPAHKALHPKPVPLLRGNMYLKALAQAHGSLWLSCTAVPGAVCGAVGPKLQEEESSASLLQRGYNTGYSSMSQTEDWLKPPAELKLFPRQLQKVKLCVCRQWVAGDRKADSSEPYK